MRRARPSARSTSVNRLSYWRTDWKEAPTGHKAPEETEPQAAAPAQTPPPGGAARAPRGPASVEAETSVPGPHVLLSLANFAALREPLRAGLLRTEQRWVCGCEGAG